MTTIIRPSLERQYKTMGMTQLPTEINTTIEVWNYSRIKDYRGPPSDGHFFDLSLVFNHTYQVTYDRASPTACNVMKGILLWNIEFLSVEMISRVFQAQK